MTDDAQKLRVMGALQGKVKNRWTDAHITHNLGSLGAFTTGMRLLQLLAKSLSALLTHVMQTVC